MNRLFKRYFILAILALGAAQGSFGQSNDWKTWKNKVFSLQHPADWTPVANNKNSNFLKLTNLTDSSSVLIVELSPGKGRSVEDLRDAVIKEFQSSSLLKTFAVEKNEISEAEGASFYELIFSGELSGKAEKIFIRGFVSADLAVQMSFTDPVETWAALEPVARKVMESFQRK